MEDVEIWEAVTVIKEVPQVKTIVVEK